MTKSHPNDLPVCTAATSDADHLLPLSVANRLPWMPRHLHVATLYRWTSRGVKGVKLSTVKVGRTRCTTEQALHDFFEALAEVDLRQVQPIPRPATSRRAHADKRARQILRMDTPASDKEAR